MKFIPELAGLRGIAALMVFVAHAAIDGFLPRFIANSYGRLGLICFFILSGYLIAQVYLFKPFTKENANSYLIARIARIFPVYFFVILISFIVSNYIYPDFHYDLKDTKIFLLSFFLINTPFEPWTIPVEIHFYGSFLLFWYLFSSKKINNLTFLLFPLILLFPTIMFAYFHGRVPHVMTSFAIFFFLGAYIALHHTRNSFEILKNKVPKYTSLFFLLLFLVLPVIRKSLDIIILRTWYDPFLLFSVAVLFVLIITKPQDFFILRIKPMIFMSEISYGFYLFHRPLMKITMDQFGTGPLAGIGLFVCCVILSWISFKFIEVPARKLIEKKYNTPKLKLS